MPAISPLFIDFGTAQPKALTRYCFLVVSAFIYKAFSVSIKRHNWNNGLCHLFQIVILPIRLECTLSGQKQFAFPLLPSSSLLLHKVAFAMPLFQYPSRTHRTCSIDFLHGSAYAIAYSESRNGFLIPIKRENLYRSSFLLSLFLRYRLSYLLAFILALTFSLVNSFFAFFRHFFFLLVFFIDFFAFYERRGRKNAPLLCHPPIRIRFIRKTTVLSFFSFLALSFLVHFRKITCFPNSSFAHFRTVVLSFFAR